MWTNEAQEALAEIGAVVEINHDGNAYVSIPTGATAEAVEIETVDGIEFNVWMFAWDRTGGLSAEVEIGMTKDLDEAVEMARLAYEARVRDLDAIEAMLDASFVAEGFALLEAEAREVGC